MASYQQIAEDIRRRILSGELAPGDQVPSTRQLAIRWGVAAATAAKALAALGHEGLVEARPRSGTVVAERGRSRRPVADRELTRDHVVAAAMEIADAEGLAALSMRGVAARLGVSTMSPYRHVGSKDEMVLLMADVAYGEAVWPEEWPEGWRERCAVVARLLWLAHRRHPWLAHITPLGLPNLLTYGERLLSALDGLGLDAVTMLDLQVLIYSHVQGLAVNLEREAQAQAVTGKSDEEWTDLQMSATDLSHLPTFTGIMAALPPEGYDLDLDRFFEFSLAILLDGVAHLIARAAPEPDGPRRTPR
ncbi:GntR family transcriptional regulator [Actinocorallia sp. A-T 12471]|uniref:GntR family transcriptional regulator n=1 Tax=Actinocorallia sp. A-T 12471 TaxID=3089813 RepID=UPI0029CB9EB1|nr:GntR family transcriptional regulator [Actinocorallia sp. A-T 12471]MDX6740858.1 GntR family transcriptional regulator [Actinocorallia sp. A-T 12471]